jgi:hypothetical protein
MWTATPPARPRNESHIVGDGGLGTQSGPNLGGTCRQNFAAFEIACTKESAVSVARSSPANSSRLKWKRRLRRTRRTGDGVPTRGGIVDRVYTIKTQSDGDGKNVAYVVHLGRKIIATFPFNDSTPDAMGYANRFIGALTRRDVASRLRKFLIKK